MCRVVLQNSHQVESPELNDESILPYFIPAERRIVLNRLKQRRTRSLKSSQCDSPRYHDAAIFVRNHFVLYAGTSRRYKRVVSCVRMNCFTTESQVGKNRFPCFLSLIDRSWDMMKPEQISNRPAKYGWTLIVIAALSPKCRMLFYLKPLGELP